jgi:hypothetical protein
MSAKIAIDYFLVSSEQSLQQIIKEKGVQLIKVGPEFAKIVEAYKKTQRAGNIATAKGFGVKDPEKIIDTYERLLDKKWRALSKDIGRDVNKFTEVLNREIYSKIDINKL